MEEEGDSKLSLSCFDCSQDRSLRSVFCSIGREIAELMQSLQLNGTPLVTLILLMFSLLFCNTNTDSYLVYIKRRGEGGEGGEGGGVYRAMYASQMPYSFVPRRKIARESFTRPQNTPDMI